MRPVSGKGLKAVLNRQVTLGGGCTSGLGTVPWNWEGRPALSCLGDEGCPWGCGIHSSSGLHFLPPCTGTAPGPQVCTEGGQGGQGLQAPGLSFLTPAHLCLGRRCLVHTASDFCCCSNKCPQNNRCFRLPAWRRKSGIKVSAGPHSLLNSAAGPLLLRAAPGGPRPSLVRDHITQVPAVAGTQPLPSLCLCLPLFS